MRRLIPILRCNCPRCATATRRWFLAIIAICVTIAASWELLVEEHESVPGGDEFVVGPRARPLSAGFNEYSALDQPSETARLRTAGSVAASGASEAKNELPKPRLSSELFNAALAAGLIDPSRTGLLGPLVPTMSPTRELAVSLNGPGVSIQNPDRGMESGGPLVTVAVATLTASDAANPTKPLEVAPAVSPTTDKIVALPPIQSAEAEPDARMPAPPHGENRRKGSIPGNKSSSVRFIAKAEIGSPGNSAAHVSMSRTKSSPDGAKADSSTDQRTGDRDSPSRDLSENLQRFASDFVRADQTDNVAEQHRFFAESVHFYREGDLSLAGVEAAMRRHHRDQQSKRSEVAGPAVATGPVNGGFFMIKQPVRWTQSQGSKVAQGRSVLQLRVVPLNHGGWKITSIDELSK
jgi:hypothetical protein